MKTHPTKIERDGEERIFIEWSDGQKRVYDVTDLRKNCPCAECAAEKEREKKRDPMELRVIPQSQTQPIRLVGMKPVGRYAYHLQFSDNHNTGIFTFEYLRERGEAVE